MAIGAAGADHRSRDVALPEHLAAQVRAAVLGMDAWFDSQRVPGGYGGPVVHWWRDCLDYTGPGLDWRYEGIVIGYLNLWERTGQQHWLEKAKLAGDDLLQGQLPNGNYRNSCFEHNPNSGGTPHEAACDLALIRLAMALRSAGEEWQPYRHAAEWNLTAFHIGKLWDGKLWEQAAGGFRDGPTDLSLVPNKCATIAEALLALTSLTGEERWAARYALPALEAVVRHQLADGPMRGAIYQSSIEKRPAPRFFPFYIARCVPALLAGHAFSGDARLADAARGAAQFVAGTRFDDGSFPQIIYADGRCMRYPQWVAPAGDIARALELARGDLAGSTAFEPGEAGTLEWLLRGRREDGGWRTAVGFGRVAPGAAHADHRDEISVCGWVDKAFRYLTALFPETSV